MQFTDDAILCGPARFLLEQRGSAHAEWHSDTTTLLPDCIDLLQQLIFGQRHPGADRQPPDYPN